MYFLLFMGIVKLSSSRNQVQFVTDEGVVYVTSKKYLLGLLNKNDAQEVLVLNKFALQVSADRFPKSSVWNPNGVESNEGVELKDDVFSPKVREELKKVEGFKDKSVW